MGNPWASDSDRLGLEPSGTSREAFVGSTRQFLHLQNGPESENKAAGGPQGCGADEARLRSRGKDAPGAAGREDRGEGPPGGARSGGTRADSPPPEGEGRGGARRVASRRAPPAAVFSSRHSWSPRAWARATLT